MPEQTINFSADEYDADRSYVIHLDFKVDSFWIVDSTTTGWRANDHTVWVGCGNSGRSLSPEIAIELADAIKKVALSHLARHAAKSKP